MIFNSKNIINIKCINKMAFPLVLNSLSSLTIGLVDQAMVGRISIFAYGAVGVVATTLYSISGILGMLGVSFNILGAQSKGLDDKDSLFNKTRITIALSVFIGLLFYIFILIFKVPILKICFGIHGSRSSKIRSPETAAD